jgi:hypothetical protein
MLLRSRIATLALLPLATLGGLAVASAAPAAASTKTITVKAVETDFHIALSRSTFSPGRYTFEAENKGQTTHALEITGPGLKHPRTSDIAPGKSAKLTVTFKKGKYDIFCPIPGHKALGMNKELTVSSSSSSSSSSGAATTTTTTKPAASGGYGY